MVRFPSTTAVGLRNREDSMEMNRNHFLMIGLVVLFLGIQFRRVEKYVLNEEVSRFLNERQGDPAELPTTNATPNPFFSPAQERAPELQVPVARRELSPPNWLGWVCVSIGGVLVLQSLAMRKPGG